MTLRKRDEARAMIAEQLSSVCGITIPLSAFLDPAYTSSLKERFFRLVATNEPHNSHEWHVGDEQSACRHLIQLSQHNGQQACLLFNSIDNVTGSVRVPFDLVVQNAFPIWKIVGEDLCIATENLHDGLCLEINYQDLSGAHVRNGVYELTSWGSFYMGMTESCG